VGQTEPLQDWNTSRYVPNIIACVKTISYLIVSQNYSLSNFHHAYRTLFKTYSGPSHRQLCRLWTGDYHSMRSMRFEKKGEDVFLFD